MKNNKSEMKKNQIDELMKNTFKCLLEIHNTNSYNQRIIYLSDGYNVIFQEILNKIISKNDDMFLTDYLFFKSLKSDIFETKDVDTEEAVWYAVVNVEHLEHTLEIKVSKLLGVVK